MKRYVLTIIITAIIFTGVGVLATTVITADQINYDENTTVKDKIDDLYTQTSNSVLNRFRVSLDCKPSNSTNSSICSIPIRNNSDNIKNYKYFKIISLTPDSNIKNCKLYSYSDTQNTGIEPTLNTQYNVYSSTDGYKFGSIYINATSKTNGTAALCTAVIEFYN